MEKRFFPHRGEILVEYFVIFVVVAFLTILGLTNFDGDLKTTLTRYFQTASAKLVGSDSVPTTTCPACDDCDAKGCECGFQASGDFCDRGRGCDGQDRCLECVPCPS